MAAGDAVTMTRPWFYRGNVHPTPSVMPALTLASRAAWPSGWVREKGFQNGVTVTLQKPMAAIQTSDLGIIGYVSTGAHGIQVQSQFKLPTAGLLEKLGSFYKVTDGTTDIWNFDPTDEMGTYPVSEFRAGIEGIAQAGSLYATAKIVRFVGFRGQQGGNIALRHDHSGNDAGLYPTMTLQLLPYTITDAETDVDIADITSLFGVWLNIAVA